VAQMLVTHGRSLADLKAGVVLGEQGAMSVERVAALTAEHEALTVALEDAQSDVTTLSHCAAVQQHLEQVLLATKKGELAVARQAVLVSR
jgi:ribosomal protein L17